MSRYQVSAHIITNNGYPNYGIRCLLIFQEYFCILVGSAVCSFLIDNICRLIQKFYFQQDNPYKFVGYASKVPA